MTYIKYLFDASYRFDSFQTVMIGVDFSSVDTLITVSYATIYLQLTTVSCFQVADNRCAASHNTASTARATLMRNCLMEIGST